jgi:dienelactone hydrolase
MLGSAAAETKVTTAMRVWRGRQLVQAYRKAGPGQRAALVNKGADDDKPPTVDEMLQLLPLMPPLDPDKKLPAGITQQKTLGTTYELQLPDEYQHGRPTPVLIVLHQAGETANAMMNRWADTARAEGFILAAPSWSQGGNGGYAFTSTEQDTVVETLRDLRRRFNVDSDRVFLFGFGEGGTMAFDVGLSHPDLFAGVLPMCGNPDAQYCRSYWPNAQYLPFYVVSGEAMGTAAKACKELFEKWVPKGFVGIHVQYKGRGQEWFSGEVQSMFEWMIHKRRSIPATQLGQFGAVGLGCEFHSHRATDTHFYWLTADSVHQRHFLTGNPVVDRQIFPARLSATLNPAANSVLINVAGYEKVTVWLPREAKLDLEKPITIRINTPSGTSMQRRTVSPSLTTLLDDFCQRLDHQRLYVAKLELR